MISPVISMRSVLRGVALAALCLLHAAPAQAFVPAVGGPLVQRPHPAAAAPVATRRAEHRVVMQADDWEGDGGGGGGGNKPDLFVPIFVAVSLIGCAPALDRVHFLLLTKPAHFFPCRRYGAILLLDAIQNGFCVPFGNLLFPPSGICFGISQSASW